MKNVYVAGAIELCEKYIQLLRNANFQITHDWCNVIREVGESNPRDASLEQMLKWSTDDFQGVAHADLVWLLIPENYSLGSWIEYGAALGVRFWWKMDTGPEGQDYRKRVIVSGDWKKIIFTSMANHRFDTHEEAFNWITAQR